MMSTCPTRPSPRRARLALACVAIAALAACGGQQRTAPTTAAPADVSTPSDEALIVGPDVDADWLGATWDGALDRLAANPDAVVGLCTPPPVPTVEPPDSVSVPAPLAVPVASLVVVSAPPVEVEEVVTSVAPEPPVGGSGQAPSRRRVQPRARGRGGERIIA